MNDGRKVKKVTTPAATAPDRKGASAPKIARVQPPTKPTNDTTMIAVPASSRRARGRRSLRRAQPLVLLDRALEDVGQHA